MEQKSINRILIISVAVCCTALIGAAIFVLTLNQKVKELEALETTNSELTGSPVVAPETITKLGGFVGRPLAVITINELGEKVIELRGHATENTNKAYEDVPNTDTVKRKVVINTDTILRRVVEGAGIPKIVGVEFAQFAIAENPETYVVSFEAKEGEEITETTPAHSIVIFAK
ncbi:MAG: hypothetical protein UT41_C0001G0081 [Candidatus Wolfebacteria bacterium GW2011_GWC2_39_22]|uniref:Uncharacterized protein n=1 Tax=Candidatus Wolfebacteria bacterium GW2011_GWC2_39_22 TaxID=1619013 RepID=A0A0G0RFU3_9BACT|nr:MAG: hypothetical protein UT41_C0001G0081 [Candidatus Wolfebacteria bacterium GW2011_GWC2_39_22]HBI25740.1 hypothetical protein [Candidatus Wolfebacteria bacterium]